MNTYYYLILAIIILTVLFKVLSLNTTAYLFFSSTIVGLFEGLRGLQVGTDTHFYFLTMHYSRVIPFKTILTSFPRMAIDEHWGLVETGYILYNKILSLFFSSDRAVLIITSLLICWGFAHFIKDSCDNVYIGMFFFICGGMYFYSFNVMRQYLAMSICLNCYTLLKKKKYFRSVILFLIAMTIHQSSLVFLIIMLIFVAVKALKTDRLKIVFAVVPFFTPLFLELVGKIVPMYSGYTTSHLFSVDINGIVFLWIFMAVLMIYYLYKYYNFYDDEYYFVIICGLFYIVFQIMSIQLTGMYRVSFWFYCFQLLLFSNFAKYLPNSFYKAIYYVSISVLMVGMFISFSSAPTIQYSFFS